MKNGTYGAATIRYPKNLSPEVWRKLAGMLESVPAKIGDLREKLRNALNLFGPRFGFERTTVFFNLGHEVYEHS